MGFLNKILGGKSPEEKENKRKNKFIKNETKINEIISEFKPEITKRPHKLFFRLNLAKNINLAKTKEEYTICANQFKDWFDISLKYYKMDLSFSEQLKWVPQDQMQHIEWNSFLETLNDGFKALAISGQYEELLKYNNDYFTEFLPILARMKVRIPKNVKVNIMNINVVSSTISLFAAFSLYKLGSYEESREIFNANASFKIEFDNDEDDYEREVFKEYNNEIVPRDFIKRMKQGNMITCPNCGKEISERALRCKYCKTTLKSSGGTNVKESNFDADAAAKETVDLRSEMENLKDNQDLLKDIAFNDEDLMRRATAIPYIDNEETLLEIINNENEDERVRGIAVTNENISDETLDDILKNNQNQHLREMAKASKDLRMGKKVTFTYKG